MSLMQRIAALRGQRQKKTLKAKAVKNGFLEEAAWELPLRNSLMS